MKNFFKETLLLAILSLLVPIILFFLGADSLLFIAYFGFLYLLIPHIIAQLVSSLLFWHNEKKDSFFKLFFLRSLYLMIAMIIALIFQSVLYKDWIEDTKVVVFISIIVFSSLTFNNFLFFILKKITEILPTRAMNFFILLVMTSCNFFSSIDSSIQTKNVDFNQQDIIGKWIMDNG